VQHIFRNDRLVSPKISIVLLDWSCRESFHILDYLESQTVARSEYELIWIEYYSRKSSNIEERFKQNERLEKSPPLDQWLLMEIPNDVYYHKHLLYNAAILASRSNIITFCDSDALVQNTFIEAILRCFDQESDIVAHLDQARNNDKQFYPFNYPSIEKVIGEGCINWHNGKTTGLWDTEDILHTRNYGACMAARREDLIAIGGADEHIDYLGHICGPYEMTFRLVNAGKREVWHPTEFLYHVWHPGQAGETNYVGPHDGQHMSTRALQAKFSGRILPFVENSAMRKLRLGKSPPALEQILPLVVSEERLQSWSIDNLPKLKTRLWRTLQPSRDAILSVRLLNAFSKVLLRQARQKAVQLSLANGHNSKDRLERNSASVRHLMGQIAVKAAKVYSFAKRTLEFCVYATERSRECLNAIADDGNNELSLYGTGDLADIFYALTFDASIKVKNIYDDFGGKRFHAFKVLPLEKCGSAHEKIVIASFIGVEEKLERLKRCGVPTDRIVVLQ
jgi:hypothetical protein